MLTQALGYAASLVGQKKYFFKRDFLQRFLAKGYKQKFPLGYAAFPRKN